MNEINKFYSPRAQAHIHRIGQLLQQLKVEDQLETFLREPKAEMHRSRTSGHYVVKLTVDGTRVAGAESRTSYVDALANALWALQLWRDSEQAEALALVSGAP